MQERLQKLIAQAGITSRRDAEELITHGRVTVNGVAAHLGDKADLAVDDVRVDGEKLHIDTKRIYIMINKPMGIVTATRAQEQEIRRTVRDLVPIEGHLYPVGRLDADSEGLVVLTDDGELAQKLTHPRYQHPKVYEVTLRGLVPEEALNIWRRGIVLEDGLTKPVDIRVLTRDKESSQIRITMREGRKRQIRRIAKLLGYPVRHLVRTELDTLVLGDLAVGTWRYLTEGEIRDLQQSAASTKHRLKVDPRYNPAFDPRSRKKPAQDNAAEPANESRPAVRRPTRASSARRPAPHGPDRRSTRSGSSDTSRPRTSGSAVRYTRSRSEASDGGESPSQPDPRSSEAGDSRSSNEYRQARLTQAGIRPSSRSGSRGKTSSQSGTRSSSRSSSRPSSRSNNKPGSKSGGKLRSGRPSKIGGKSRGKSGSRSSGSSSKSRGKPRDER